MFTILMWIVFGFVVGLIARALHPQDAPVGCLPTIGVGVAGSFIGGGINWLLGFGHSPFEPSGFLMSILGGFLCLMAWRWYVLKTSPQGPRSFFSGKLIKKN
jgi:uncharacterized membrane protein YeaQ/YmgE (transglycosylase-associated protein family)